MASRLPDALATEQKSAEGFVFGFVYGALGHATAEEPEVMMRELFDRPADALRALALARRIFRSSFTDTPSKRACLAAFDRLAVALYAEKQRLLAVN